MDADDAQSAATFSDYLEGEEIEPQAKKAKRQKGTTGVSHRADSPEPYNIAENVNPLQEQGCCTFAELELAFYQHHIDIAESRDDADIKRLPLPLSRIKKVMRADPEVKLIAGEVPYLFTKLCEIFIAELSARSWIESGRRVTLTRADVAAAIQKSDSFDFLVDIVPREGGESASSATRDRRRAAIKTETPTTPTFDAHINALDAIKAADELLATASETASSMATPAWSPSALYIPATTAM